MQKQYSINKGVNRPIEFRGLQAQYVWYLAGAAMLTLLTFSVLYLTGISTYANVPLSLTLGGLLITRIYRMNRKYGQFGRMKRRARRAIPTALRSHSRKCFTHLIADHEHHAR